MEEEDAEEREGMKTRWLREHPRAGRRWPAAAGSWIEASAEACCPSSRPAIITTAITTIPGRNDLRLCLSDQRQCDTFLVVHTTQEKQLGYIFSWLFFLTVLILVSFLNTTFFSCSFVVLYHSSPSFLSPLSSSVPPLTK